MTAGYYDIHTHILPGVDDGSESMEQSVEMLHMAYDQGIRHIVATPHYTPGGRNHPVEELKEKLEGLRKEAAKIDQEMTIDLGNELLNGPGIIEALDEGRALTMAGTRYVLIEFVPPDSYKKINRALRDLVMHGYIPIVAHMERYEALYKEIDRVEELAKNGCYFQMNAETLVGGIFNRRAAYHRRLVEDGYIQFFGSDCHNTKERKPLMQDALKYFGKEALEERFLQKVLIDYPKTMLSDKYLSI